MRNTTPLTLSLLLAFGAGACTTGQADDGAGRGAKLTIVGESALRLENTWATELTVRYTDRDGQPLAGDVAFTLDGDVAGAFLDVVDAQTDADGKATITLTAGETGDATFTVDAEAADAAAVQWDVAVAARVLDVAGDYHLRSEFDLASGIPGTAGQVVNTFIAMTDGPYDPATWVLDQIQAAINNGTINNFIDMARPALDAILEELLTTYSPDIVQQIIHVGNAFGQIATKFGTSSTLHVTASNDVDHPFAAQHELTDFVFTIDGDDYDYPLADLGMANVSAAPGFGYDATRFTLGDHQFPISYGSLLMVALEQIIIPLVDGNASDLSSFLTDLIDCASVGQAISDEIGFGSPSLYEGACTLGVGAAAHAIENQIRGLDQTAMMLDIGGNAHWMDTNHDSKVDVLQGGVWQGQMSYAGAPAPLGPSTFHGEHVAQP